MHHQICQSYFSHVIQQSLKRPNMVWCLDPSLDSHVACKHKSIRYTWIHGLIKLSLKEIFSNMLSERVPQLLWQAGAKTCCTTVRSKVVNSLEMMKPAQPLEKPALWYQVIIVRFSLGGRELSVCGQLAWERVGAHTEARQVGGCEIATETNFKRGLLIKT